jgi:PAS domain S-box-containing protein
MNKQLEALFPLIFDSINEGVFTVDSNFRITSFNAAAEKITGANRKEALGKRCYEVFRASICQNGCALRRTLENSEPYRDVLIDILNHDMMRVPITVSTAVLRDSTGNMVGGVEIFRDVSDEEQLRNTIAGRHRFMDIIGKSSVMQELFALIPKVAKSQASVLICGSSGTGKELVAQAIHDLSSRNETPFVRVNCGALPDTLLESELFGYRKGAFTGASQDKPGRFHQADGGTLFLDEIGDVSPAFQVKLLRALEEGEIQSLGDTKTKKVDVRLISATNRNLEEMTRTGSFREDLFYRIRVISINLPSLKERRNDIPLLAEHFARVLSVKNGQKTPKISKRAMQVLYDYDYPGNIRELRNIIERALVLVTGGLIDLPHLPPELSGDESRRVSGKSIRPSERRIANTEISTRKSVTSPEGQKLLSILNHHGWNRNATAETLNIGRTTLWRRMKEYGLL